MANKYPNHFAWQPLTRVVVKPADGGFVVEVREMITDSAERIICGSIADVVALLVSHFHRPVANFNIGKAQEFKDRRYFREPNYGSETKSPALRNGAREDSRQSACEPA